MTNNLNSTFNYVYSCSLETNVQIKIGTLEGIKHNIDYEKILSDPMKKFSGLYQKQISDLVVYCQVYSDNKPLSLPVSTSYKHFTNRWSWNEWVILPIQFSDLPRNALLTLTVYDCAGPTTMTAVGGTSISLFGKHGVFRQGMIDLRVWPDREANGNISSTPGKCLSDTNRMQSLAKLAKQHRNGNIPEVDWLDRLTFREIELINEKEKKTSNYPYLMIEFPEIISNGTVYSVVHYEQDGDEIYPFRVNPDIVTVPDAEVMQENLVESKHHKLARSLRSGISDKDAKPTATIRDMLNTIVGYPPTKILTTEEQDLIWKYRFYLCNQKKALTKFLECVNWKLHGEAMQALDMMYQWAPMDVDDSLRLLSPAFKHSLVRKYAVERLQQATDEDLLLYLLQLVQALKYENFEHINNSLKLMEDKYPVTDSLTESVSGLSLKDSSDSNIACTINHFEMCKPEDMDLARFLIHRASKNFSLANYFYWYLMIECEDQDSTIKQDIRVRNMYLSVMKTFLMTLYNGSAECQRIHGMLTRQQNFIDRLVRIIKTVARESGNRKKKIDKLQALLGETDTKFSFISFEPLHLPLDPSIHITGIVPEKAVLFKSALMPSRLTFMVQDNKEYVAIFKHGDDLRQDQLILQIITLMDKLLRSENLDLKLTPYRVLATSTRHGFVQFVNSLPVAEILATEGSIQNYFRKTHPNENAPFGISSDIMENYIKSCAGYCVITYLLGVGDRHFDNLLLTSTGKLFHIDFGYILGRDPKPLPPPMKLSKEMVEAMGGVNSEHYHEFRKLCYTAFLHLRRHANLILNLFSLMVDASVPDIALEPDKTVNKVQDKFRLDLGDEEAVHYFQNLLDVSVTAVMAVLVEQLHKFAQYWRK
ncbi:phosphatidylinositol 3-kinase catalytic subunit type 3 [Acyrthosiphon pisum]|uniref:Phosphatidylinositol 3-kinase catalytic subunit type 3 n=1 Tax=Acyrthosiphon pisum TaxID=7029 RepID=A0A8R2A323_ACYPI|nr:phosphatidylinositol 3-kinase catalytic subunit type 3 [Acyrthosiphon pisum]|eukprot:XP_001943231.1 PREDICTED: phosphatidylinositol 3-kinase catalytic subunit type 3 [Acyrthosiphon pisum]